MRLEYELKQKGEKFIDPLFPPNENSLVSKNSNGEYDTDFISCVLWQGVAESTVEYCKKGDIIGVKGRIQTSNYEKDGEKVYSTDIIAEKVTFLSSKKAE